MCIDLIRLFTLKTFLADAPLELYSNYTNYSVEVSFSEHVVTAHCNSPL